MWGKSELRMKGFALKKSRRGEGIGEDRTGTEENNGISYVGRMVRSADECFESNFTTCETEMNYTKQSCTNEPISPVAERGQC